MSVPIIIYLFSWHQLCPNSKMHAVETNALFIRPQRTWFHFFCQLNNTDLDENLTLENDRVFSTFCYYMLHKAVLISVDCYTF